MHFIFSLILVFFSSSFYGESHAGQAASAHVGLASATAATANTTANTTPSANTTMTTVTASTPAPAPAPTTTLITLDEIRAYVDSQEFQIALRVRSMFEEERTDDTDPKLFIVHEDPLACRYCRGASRVLLKYLKRDLGQIQWIPVDTSAEPTGSLEGFQHRYVYSPDLNLIVDPTYRQFLLQLPDEEFKKLPRIFVGTPDMYRALTIDKMSAEDIEVYLAAVWNWDLPKTHVRDSQGEILYRTVGGGLRRDWRPTEKEVTWMAAFLAKCRLLLTSGKTY